MMKKSTCIDLASLSQERLLKYKKFSVAFFYPDAEFLTFFPEQKDTQEELSFEYDHLFRNNEIWLYTTEYTAENEFQKAQGLADISGFYKAFGLEPNKDRPDALVTELEFMHYLIFKEINATSGERAFICLDAQKKFFSQHLFPAAKNIGRIVISRTKNHFYREIAQQLFTFVESEAVFLKLN